MLYDYDDDKLVITAERDDFSELLLMKKEDPESFGSDQAMIEFFESLTCNSDLQWIDPSDTGDLTDAPILGILGDEQRENSGPFGAVFCGHDRDGKLYQPILNRWGFMDYQFASVLDRLLEKGEVVFVSSH